MKLIPGGGGDELFLDIFYFKNSSRIQKLVDCLNHCPKTIDKIDFYQLLNNNIDDCVLGGNIDSIIQKSLIDKYTKAYHVYAENTSINNKALKFLKEIENVSIVKIGDKSDSFFLDYTNSAKVLIGCIKSVCE
jgi:hypothetical protein